MYITNEENEEKDVYMNTLILNVIASMCLDSSIVANNMDTTFSECVSEALAQESVDNVDDYLDDTIICERIGGSLDTSGLKCID